MTEQIGSTIAQLMDAWKHQRGGERDADPEELIKKILTKKEIGHIKIKSFRNGTVGIAVDSSAWLYTLGMRKAAIAAALRRGNPSVKDIRFFLGEIA